MKIKQVEVRKLYTYGNYKNISFGFVAETTDESTADVVSALTMQCDLFFNNFLAGEGLIKRKQNDVQTLEFKVQHLECDIKQLTDEYNKAKERFDKVAKFMDRLGIDLENYVDDIPF